MKAPWVHVVGGGLAGLSLVGELAKEPILPGQVIISDPRTEYSNDRTFGFWFIASEFAFLKPEFSATSWSISTGNDRVIQTGHRYHYGIRSAGNLYEEAISAIDAHPQISRIEATIDSIPDAQHVYDSRPPIVDQFKIIQEFYGTEILCSEPHGIQTVGLMDNLQVFENGVQFRYVLPLDKKRLLVEHTSFTDCPSDLKALDQLTKKWITTHFSDAQIIRQESAQIPMGYKEPINHLGYPIGARGGMTRPATGYGYRTIKYWASNEARRLIKKNVSKVFKPSSLHHWMDHLFLDLIRDRPDVIPKILISMGCRLHGDDFAQFMIRERLVDALRVIRVSPKKPFTLALIGKSKWI